MEEYTGADEDELASATSTPTPNTSKPWLREFNQYLNGGDEVPSGMMIVQWWGVSYLLFTITVSISHSYL